MPLKRQVLEQLKRDELIAAVGRFELPVADRRVQNLLIEALASSRKATLAMPTEVGGTPTEGAPLGEARRRFAAPGRRPAVE